jgi:hypothetical protein
MPKLVAFTRINMSLNDPVSPIGVSLRNAEGTVLATNVVAAEKVQQAMDDARRDENMLVGIIVRIEAAPFMATRGRYTAVVEHEGTEYVTGSIRFLGKAFGTDG